MVLPRDLRFIKLNAACHQPTGKGMDQIAPPLAQSNWVNGLENSELIKIVLYGLEGEISVNGKKYNMMPMTAFG